MERSLASPRVRMRNRVNEAGCNRGTAGEGRPWKSGGAQAGGGKADQVRGGLLAVGGLADVAFALDDAEAGHGMGQGAGDQVDAPVQLFLAEMRQQPGEF